MNAPTAAIVGAVFGGCMLILTMNWWMDISDRAAAWLIGTVMTGSAALAVGLLAIYYANGGA